MIELEASMKTPVEPAVVVVASFLCQQAVQLAKLKSVLRIKMLSGLSATLDVVGLAMPYYGVLRAIIADHTG